MSPSSPPPRRRWSNTVWHDVFKPQQMGWLVRFLPPAYLTVFLILLQKQVQRFIKRRIPFSPENRKFREKWFDLVNHFWRKIFRIDTFCSEFCIFSYSGNVQIDSFRLFCIFVWWYPRLIRCARRIREVGGKFEFRSGWWVPDGAENCSKRNFFLFFFLHFIRFFLPNQPSKQMT